MIICLSGSNALIEKYVKIFDIKFRKRNKPVSCGDFNISAALDVCPGKLHSIALKFVLVTWDSIVMYYSELSHVSRYLKRCFIANK